MAEIILKCWNGIYGCCSFEIENWQDNFNSIDKACEYYVKIWGHCWVEDSKGNVIKKYQLDQNDKIKIYTKENWKGVELC